ENVAEHFVRPNADVLDWLEKQKICCDLLAYEMVASYGMPVGREVVETVLWTGRFVERWSPYDATKVYRREVKTHLCGSMKAKDPNVWQAIIDRFGPGKEIAV